MRKYIIYCTEEQTKKAYELGAPITKIILDKESGTKYFVPTAEQMIGWLEENNVSVSVFVGAYNMYDYRITIDRDKKKTIKIENNRPTACYYYNYRDAVIASIDRALEYLNERKENDKN